MKMTLKTISGVALAIAATFSAHAEGPFNGLIVDGHGEPVSKAKIWVSDPAAFASSDKQGRFGLSEVQPDDTLNVKVKKEVYRIAIDGRKSIKITIVETGVKETSEEPEIADLGYGYVKRRERVTASSGITGAQLRATGASSIMEALRGLVPGLTRSGNPRGGDQSASIRGTHSFTASSEPLYVVDGTIVQSLDTYNLYDVELVEVLKDAPIYGSRGANGAILVTTSRGKH